jgi:hypothetical protein
MSHTEVKRISKSKSFAFVDGQWVGGGKDRESAQRALDTVISSRRIAAWLDTLDEDGFPISPTTP